ncbi:response regulator transcription factor [Arsenophonus apicola]|uniref:Response regulator transcription factor n=1 Tax=Arsenophonus apicola TaxID=2879119 RepID=A0ABY8P2B3_9GAMM|nr:response regulator transcription factor [Arsenophonus apicola]WGO83635.1 response regulator transcription factor [Arsenophonus apicola]
MKKIEVVVLDDHSIILSGIEKELESIHVSVSNSYTNSHDLKKYLATNTPDIIIMDYALSPEDLDGLTLIKDLHKRYNKLKILVISAYSDLAIIGQIFRCGAKGFISKKNAKKQQLINAIDAIYKGKYYFNQVFDSLKKLEFHYESITDNSSNSILSNVSVSDLSKKELEVIRCFLNGLTVSMIAQKYNRSIKTISGQKQTALRKLGLTADHQLFIIKDEILKNEKI